MLAKAFVPQSIHESLSKFRGSYSQDEGLNLPDESNFKKLNSHHKDETSESWRSLVKFGDNLEYDYSAIIDRKSWKKYVHKTFRVKDSKVGLFFDAKEKIPEKRIEFVTLENGGNSPDVILQWDAISSSLSAELKSSIRVSYTSHLNEGKESEMEKDKSIPLFCFQTLRRQLVKGGTQNTFDPHGTKLKFKADTGKRSTDVTLQSRAAGCLYQTFVMY